MTILDILKLMPNYKARIQVTYFPKDYAHNPKIREERSQIMMVKNVTYKHIDHWTFRKEVWKVLPAVDKQGKPYMFVQLKDKEDER